MNYFIIAFAIMSLQLNAQTTKDTLKQLFLTDEELFVDLVSQYYSLSHAQIDQYQKYLNFDRLSDNKRIDWTSSLFEMYKDRWNFFGICRNKSFPWNETTIKKYHNEAWFYLREVIRDRKIYLGKNFISENNINVDSDFIVQSDISDELLLYIPKRRIDKSNQRTFGYYLNVQDRTVNHPDTLSTLSLLKSKNISEFESAFLRHYRTYIYWSNYSWSEYVKWDLKRIVDLAGLFVNPHLLDNEDACMSVFVNHFDDNFVEEMFELIAVQQLNKLHLIDYYAGNNFTARAKYASGYRTNFADEFVNENKTLPESLKEKDFVIGYEYSFPAEFCDYHVINSYHRNHSCRLVSPKLKSILEQFSLPNHKFYPVTIHSKSYWYGDEKRPYYLLVLSDMNHDEIDLSNITVQNSANIFNSIDIINSQQSDALITFIEPNSLRFRSNSTGSYLNDTEHYSTFIHNIPIKNEYDLISYDGISFYMSKRLIDCLDENEITGYFVNYFHYPKFDNSSEERQAQLCIKSPDINKEQKNITRYQIMRDSVQMIKKDAISFETYVKTNQIQGITELEKKLEVIFPDKYREFLDKKIRYQFFDSEREYDYYPEKMIEKTHYSWINVYPKTHNGITIAANGLGDYLALILEDKSPYKLSSMIYKLEHEIGEFIPYKDLGDL